MLLYIKSKTKLSMEIRTTSKNILFPSKWKDISKPDPRFTTFETPSTDSVSCFVTISRVIVILLKLFAPTLAFSHSPIDFKVLVELLQCIQGAKILASHTYSVFTPVTIVFPKAPWRKLYRWCDWKTFKTRSSWVYWIFHLGIITWRPQMWRLLLLSSQKLEHSLKLNSLLIETSHCKTCSLLTCVIF